jgi:hypothetical protein
MYSAVFCDKSNAELKYSFPKTERFKIQKPLYILN